MKDNYIEPTSADPRPELEPASRGACDLFLAIDVPYGRKKLDVGGAVSPTVWVEDGCGATLMVVFDQSGVYVAVRVSELDRYHDLFVHPGLDAMLIEFVENWYRWRVGASRDLLSRVDAGDLDASEELARVLELPLRRRQPPGHLQDLGDADPS